MGATINKSRFNGSITSNSYSKFGNNRWNRR